jgi:Glutamate decarboxylase and related PLP-dependent proteins
MINCRGCGRKWSWPDFKCFLEFTRVNEENHQELKSGVETQIQDLTHWGTSTNHWMAYIQWADDISSVWIIWHLITGTTIAGHVDNVLRLQELCKQHDIWLHLRGHSLAALAMVSVQNMVSSVWASVKLSVCWDARSCCQASRCQHCRGTCCLYHHVRFLRQQVCLKCVYISIWLHSIES